jgi:hypothetical protein
VAPRSSRRPTEIATEHWVVRHERVAAQVEGRLASRGARRFYIRLPNESLKLTSDLRRLAALAIMRLACSLAWALGDYNHLMRRPRSLFRLLLRLFGIGLISMVAIWSVTGDVERPGVSLHVDGVGGAAVCVAGGLLALGLAQFLSHRAARRDRSDAPVA